jgi:hypothetical protein
MICGHELRHMIYRGSAIVPTSTLISLFKVFFFFFFFFYKVESFSGIVLLEVFGIPRVW